MPATPAAVTKYFDYLNNDRFEELRDIFADDIRMEMAGAVPRRGVDDAVAFYTKALAPLPRHHDSPDAVWVDPSGTRVCVEISFVGRTCDDRPVTFTAIDVFHLGNEGRIEWLRSFYDTTSVTRQLRPPAGPG
jgi:ketosteroid isomerase-like protein